MFCSLLLLLLLWCVRALTTTEFRVTVTDLYVCQLYLLILLGVRNSFMTDVMHIHTYRQWTHQTMAVEGSWSTTRKNRHTLKIPSWLGVSNTKPPCCEATALTTATLHHSHSLWCAQIIFHSDTLIFTHICRQMHCGLCVHCNAVFCCIKLLSNA